MSENKAPLEIVESGSNRIRFVRVREIGENEIVIGIDKGIASAARGFADAKRKSAEIPELANGFAASLLETLNAQSDDFRIDPERLVEYTYTMEAASAHSVNIREHLEPDGDPCKSIDFEYACLNIYCLDVGHARQKIATIYMRLDRDEQLLDRVKFAIYEINNTLCLSNTLDEILKRSLNAP